MLLGKNIEAQVEFEPEGWCILKAWDLVRDRPVPEDWLDSLATAYEEELAEEHYQWLVGRAEDAYDSLMDR